MKIKVCGITGREDALELKNSHVSFLGFIFYKSSPRNAFLTEPETIKELGNHFETVGVFVNEAFDNIVEICRKRGITTVQLHGNESNEFCQKLKSKDFRVIKAIPVGCDMTAESLNNLSRQYYRTVDYLLFDTKGKNVGGNGTKFNWEILEGYDGDIPYLLSGGIGPEDVGTLKSLATKSLNGFSGLDLNSRFETSPGKKDTSKIIEFLNNLNPNNE
ncbi:MAG: phosphoribosylanthranilate isomerase [Muribaculaceae bacterium]|nr:phosphoribosylanthranilate isomerase [Muribaculaceae bacterium]